MPPRGHAGFAGVAVWFARGEGYALLPRVWRNW
jgi:hypothetical protein